MNSHAWSSLPLHDATMIEANWSRVAGWMHRLGTKATLIGLKTVSGWRPPADAGFAAPRAAGASMVTGRPEAASVADRPMIIFRSRMYLIMASLLGEVGIAGPACDGRANATGIPDDPGRISDHGKRVSDESRWRRC